MRLHAGLPKTLWADAVSTVGLPDKPRTISSHGVQTS